MDLNEIMSVPYRDHGRNLDGLDCWGLVRWVHHHHFNRPLMPSFSDIEPDDKAGMTQGYAALVGGFECNKAVPGALACHFVEGTLVHIGIVIEECGLKVLHTGRGWGKPTLNSLRSFERMCATTRYYA
jgi:hypothetical protein